MARIGERGDLIKCSFCGKNQKQVIKMIAGPGVYICDGCIDLCCEILDAYKVPFSRWRAARSDMLHVLPVIETNFNVCAKL